MRVLYGVQATGNGHITRARVMAPALQQAGVEVDYLFSGRPADQLFDMQPFGDYQVRRGLTFHMADGGRVNFLKTLLGNRFWQFYQDTRQLDLSSYDLVISDFEPVTAWAARRQRVTCVGLAHQYAFLHRLPDGYYSRLLKPMVQGFAPVTQAVGIHWNSFGGPIVPPLIAPPNYPATNTQRLIVVYLPHESAETLHYWLSGFPGYRFHVYAAIASPFTRQNVHFFPLSRQRFEQDLAACAGVISNCGFGLASEALQYGKKLLCKPLKGQWEQLSNGRILAKLGLAQVVDRWQAESIERWLLDTPPPSRPWPNVAQALAQWIRTGCAQPVDSLAAQLWQRSVCKSRQDEYVGLPE